MAVRRRRLTDLYIKGKKILIDDGEVDENGDPDPIEIYMRKLNSVESEKAMRGANAAKAAVVAALRDVTSQDYLVALNEAETLGGRDGYIQVLVDDAIGRLYPKVEAEISDEEEWKKDGYLQGLMDAWNGGFMEKHFNEPDEDTERVWSELQRFNQQIEKRLEGERKSLRRDYEERDDDWLLKQVIKSLLERRADFEWLRHYRRWELYFAVRDPDDPTKPYFQSYDEVAELANELFIRLVQEYSALAVDPTEGKSLRAAESSSDSSVSPEQPATELSSGLKVVEPSKNAPPI